MENGCTQGVRIVLREFGIQGFEIILINSPSIQHFQLILTHFRSGQLTCQRIFEVSSPVNAVCLHPNQSEIIVGEQNGQIHLWDLKTDKNVLVVSINRKS
jgi:WD40 repeat protein